MLTAPARLVPTNLFLLSVIKGLVQENTVFVSHKTLWLALLPFISRHLCLAVYTQSIV